MMSLEDHTLLNPLSDVSVPAEVQKNPRLEYSREFLLSLSSLDICKKLPKLSEFEDVLLSNADRPRTPGSLPFVGCRGNEHGSSPPTQGDPRNHSRGTYGSRWDSRSSGRSERDSDSQSDRDSESGRRFNNQHRRPWQTPEHDGLLGSGSFPRPSGYAAVGASSKTRTNEQCQLNKSREPYHPPRPYKAVPHSRRETDSFNDETFGSSESASEDKVEEERRRRASFELIRKEQQKALQEKQKMNTEKRNASCINSELTKLLENDVAEKEPFVLSDEPEISASDALSNMEKPSFAVQSPRPVVPPGFSNTQEKSSELKSLILPSSSEVMKSAREKSHLDVEVNLIQNSSKSYNIVGEPAETTQPATLSEKFDEEHSKESLDVHFRKLSFKQQYSPISSHFDSYGNLKHPEITESSNEVLNEKTVRDSKGNKSTNLEKIFGSTLPVNNALSGSVEVDDGKPDDARSRGSVQSSKFAQWFFDEEDNSSDNISSSRPNDLLSFIAAGDKTNVNSNKPLGISSSKEEAIPNVLTCEDLEQSILSAYDTNGKHVQPPVLSSSANHGSSTGIHSEPVDNHASLQLLSMLQKGTESDTFVGSGDDVKITSLLPVDPKVEENVQRLPGSSQPLTLETLFGTAFMKELQSVGAPVSAQRGPIGSVRTGSQEPHGPPPPYHFPDDEDLSHVANGIRRSGVDSAGDHRSQMREIKTENWLGFNDPQIEATQNQQIPYQNMPRQHQRSSPLLNQGWGPFHHHLESKSTHAGLPESVFSHNSPSEHRFGPNMMGPQFLHAGRGFDAFHHHHQMHGSHPRGMFPDFSGHGNEARVNFEHSLREINDVRGFPLRPHMLNVHGAQMVSGPGDVNLGGNNPPEAFERLIAMQLRANSNQIHSPFGPGGNDVDVGFQYR